MKVKIRWGSDLSGQQEEIIESFTTQGAEEQLRSKYRDVKGFRINGLSVIPDYLSEESQPTNYIVKETYYKPKTNYVYDSEYPKSTFIESIKENHSVFGGIAILLGLITLPGSLPGGIILIIIGSVMLSLPWLPFN